MTPMATLGGKELIGRIFGEERLICHGIDGCRGRLLGRDDKDFTRIHCQGIVRCKLLHECCLFIKCGESAGYASYIICVGESTRVESRHGESQSVALQLSLVDPSRVGRGLGIRQILKDSSFEREGGGICPLIFTILFGEQYQDLISLHALPLIPPQRRA